MTWRVECVRSKDAHKQLARHRLLPEMAFSFLLISFTDQHDVLDCFAILNQLNSRLWGMSHVIS